METIENMPELLRKTLKNKVEKHGLRPFCREFDIPIDNVRSILAGRDPLLSNALKISSKLGIQIGLNPAIIDRMQWEPIKDQKHPSQNLSLAEKKPPETDFRFDETPNAVWELDPQAADTEHVLVPKLNVKAAAGAGAINEGERPESLLAFRRDWLAKRGLQADYLNAIEVTGDSMVPTFCEGDTILVDRSREMPPPINSIIVARINEDEIVVKRLQQWKDDYVLLSDNPTYAPLELKKDDAFIGEVVWRGMWLVD